MAECEVEMVRVAAVVHAKGCGVDSLLETFVSDLKRRGIRVRGLIQRNYGIGCRAKMELIDLDSGDTFQISQCLGPGSSACRLNPDGVAAASMALRQALDKPMDLLVANRYGSIELQGHGLADEMLAAMCAGIPLITSVATPHLDGWRRFTGGLGDELDPEPKSIMTWWQRVMERCPPSNSSAIGSRGVPDFYNHLHNGLVQSHAAQPLEVGSGVVNF